MIRIGCFKKINKRLRARANFATQHCKVKTKVYLHSKSLFIFVITIFSLITLLNFGKKGTEIRFLHREKTEALDASKVQYYTRLNSVELKKCQRRISYKFVCVYCSMVIKNINSLFFLFKFFKKNISMCRITITRLFFQFCRNIFFKFFDFHSCSVE